jgi:hypothetical protein
MDNKLNALALELLQAEKVKEFNELCREEYPTGWVPSLQNANLEGAFLCGANLRKVNLSGANFTRADLRGADLDEANLAGANFLGADLRGVTFGDSRLPSDTILEGVLL